MFGNDEHDEAFHDMDCDDLLGQVCKKFSFPLFLYFTKFIFFYLQGPEVRKTSDKWARPSPPELDQKKDCLTFQQLDIDYYTDKPMKGMPGAQTGTVPTMRIFGVTRQQNSICCHVHGFAPYLYVTVPPQFTVNYHHLTSSLHFVKLLFLSTGRNDQALPGGTKQVHDCR